MAQIKKTTIMGQLPTDVQITVLGAPSQTADLQQWQDNIGNILAKISNSGDIIGKTISVGDITSTNGNIIGPNSLKLEIGTSANQFKFEASTVDRIVIDTSSVSYPKIYGYTNTGASTLVEFPTGAYVSSSDLFVTNTIYARGPIRNDQSANNGRVYINDDVQVTGNAYFDSSINVNSQIMLDATGVANATTRSYNSTDIVYRGNWWDGTTAQYDRFTIRFIDSDVDAAYLSFIYKNEANGTTTTPFKIGSNTVVLNHGTQILSVNTAGDGTVQLMNFYSDNLSIGSNGNTTANFYTGSNAGSSANFNFSGKWNTSFDTNAFIIDINNTSSGANSKLIDAKLSGTSKFSVSKDGDVVTSGSLKINGSKLISLGGNFSTSGANSLTLTTTASTNVTLPTTGKLTSSVASASDTQLTTTAATDVVSFTPTTNGNFMIYVYYRVVTATTNLTVDVTYTDGTGAQTVNVVSGSHTVGSYHVQSIMVNAKTTAPIKVSATAGTANNAYISASIIGI